jgi:2-alkyl-3-oxoalkanoate reductase
MKVLVTGATSLLAEGSVQRLLERGHEVRVFQRGEAGERLRGSVECIRGDIRDGAALQDAVRGCDAVIHAAAKVGVVGAWDEYRSINVGGTTNVLNAMRAHGTGRLVYVSSPSVAHGGEAIMGAGADPAITTRRGAPYAETKAQAELDVLAANATDLATVAIRPHLVWGPGDTQLVGRIVDRARSGQLALVGGGQALVDSTYVDNAAAALADAVDKLSPSATCAGKAYVIANNEPRPIRELVAGIVGAAGLTFNPRNIPRSVALRAGTIVENVWKSTRRSGEPPLTRFLAEQLSTAHWFDPRPARDDLGYLPTVMIDEGLRRLRASFASGT